MLLGGPATAGAGLLPTEIYYNGPQAGADPDEFLEITNTATTAIDLAGFDFSDGIGFTFPAFTLAAGASLILAPDPDGFGERFPEFVGPLFDASGGLSNAGETITLLDDGGATVFSVTYDDTAAWPDAADGDGASLELTGVALPLSDPGSWQAAAPDPGRWRFLPALQQTDRGDPATAVPAPAPLAMLATGLLGLGLSRHRVTKIQRSGAGHAKL